MIQHRRLLKHLARRAGYEIRQYTPLRSFAAARQELLGRIDVVVDVGANAGQYGELLREEGFGGRLISLEPVQAAYEALKARAAPDPAWTTHRLAASDAEGDIVLNVTADTRSTSALARNDRFAGAAGWSPNGTETAPARRLETLVPELLRNGERAYLKVDVQGFEDRVLDGAGAALARFDALELELSVMPLYDGQARLVDLLPFLAERGFHPVSMEPILLDDRGRLMELDGLFVRDA